MESKQKELPRLFSRPEDCCGCGGCQSVCPGEAIVMRLDEMGFLYPELDPDKCLRCHLCLAVCPLKSTEETRRSNYGNQEICAPADLR